MVLIRSRKQKPGEPFALFYENMVSMMDKAAVKVDVKVIIEI